MTRARPRLGRLAVALVVPLAVTALCLPLACDRGAPAPVGAAATQATLPEGVAADVAGDPVLVATLARIAAAQHVDPRTARDLAVRDAVFAAPALHGAGADVGAVHVAVLARALLESIDQQVRAQGPPTDAELTEVTARRFAEFDRPPAARTVHAVALVDKPEQDAAAHALADRIAAAVAGLRSQADFEKAAKAVPTAGLSVRVEALPAVTADGRTLPDPQHPESAQFDLAFAVAANGLTEVGAQSAVVKSSFGYHVILLLELIPEKRVALEERRRVLADEIYVDRARKLQHDLLERAEGLAPVQLNRAAADLLQQVQVRQ